MRHFGFPDAAICRFLYIFTACLLVYACKKDSPGREDEKFPAEQAEDISILEYVSIPVTDHYLSDEEYPAKLGKVAVTLSRKDERTLVFIVPPGAHPGNNKLTIAGLPGAVFYYRVKEVVLAATPEEEIQPFVDHLAQVKEAFSGDPEDADVRLNLTNVELVLGSASEEDKKQFAVFYKLNRGILDSLLTYEPDLTEAQAMQRRMSSARRGSPSAFTGDDEYPGLGIEDAINQDDYKFRTNAIFMGLSLVAFLVSVKAVVKGGSTFAAVCVVASAAAILVSFSKMYKYGNASFRNKWKIVEGVSNMINLFMSRRPDTAPLQMGVIPAAAAVASTTSGKLVLNANVNNLLAFNVTTRNIVSSDAAGAKERLAKIFEARAKYNELADRLNGYIQWLNEKFSFSNLKPVSRLEVPSAAGTAENPITESKFRKFTFSLDHPSLTLKRMDFNAKGKLDVQVDVDPELQDEAIDAALSYVYEDDYVRKTGEIPIVINQGPLVGEWIRQWDDVRLVEDRSRGLITSEMDDEEGYAYFRKHRLIFTPTHAYYKAINPYVKSFDGEPYKLDGQNILTADGYKHTLAKDNWEITYLADGRIRTREYYTTYMSGDYSYYIRWLYECYHYRK